MSEKKQYKTEFSFSFDQIGKKVGEMVDSLGGDAEVQHGTFTEPLNSATAAFVSLDLSIGRTTINAGSDDSMLFHADATYVGEMKFETSGEGERHIKMGQRGTAGAVFGGLKQALRSAGKKSEDLNWDIHLNPNVPLVLNIDGGVGQGIFDLSALTLTRLDLDSGVGENRITLPQSDTGYSVNVDGGVGETHLTVPESTSVQIAVDGGVGSIIVNVPADAAVRVVSDGTLGGVKVPKGFTRLNEKRDDFMDRNAVWETEGFALAEKQVEIEFDGGIGGRIVRFAKPEPTKHEPADPTDEDAPQIV
jgi:hypothetical protein